MAGLLAKFFGRTASEGAAFALGGAVSPVLEPPVQDLKNAAWLAHPSVPLEAVNMAMGVAQGQIGRDWAAGEAQLTGVNAERFSALVRVFDTGPGVAQAYALWRRNLIDEGGFRRALKREGLEPEWIDALVNAEQVLLSPENLAMMRQQGFVERPRQVAESALQGVNAERADLLFETSGLPPGIEMAQDAVNRGLIGEEIFAQIIREGHTKTKYTHLLDQLRHPILSAATWATLRLKGWQTKAEAEAGGALQGYTPEQMQLLYLAGGRPATVRQAIVGFRRGARVAGVAATEDAHVARAVEESDIRPEWIEIEHAANLTFPSAFVLRRLVGDGAVTEQEASDILFESGWRRDLADKAAHAWAVPTGAGADPHIGRAQTQLWGSLHRTYLTHETSDAAAQQGMGRLGIKAADQAKILALWQAERSLIRRTLTPAQIKKAYSKGVTNPDTGQPWTRGDAVAAIEDLGYDAADVNTYLDE